ncbi:hypothetical protein DRQ25_17600 [Candidatus Fermentibacteria bacterium]|nr:MAG: hypothetical protein DRQ25_17600 [Candidatus Fermentibacteria bacterium]
MAFSYTVNDEFISGGVRKVTGNWTLTDSTTGGEVTTGLSTILVAKAWANGAAGQTAPAFNETFPFAAGAITLASTSGYTGSWEATGF